MPARDAATVMIVRDAPAPGGGTALEVCMLRRHLDADFVGGAYVFPGGKVDPGDRGPRAVSRCRGLDDRGASARLGLERGGIGFWVAAVRECFEEAGVLLAVDAVGRYPDPADVALAGRLADSRVALNAGTVGFVEICEREGLFLDLTMVHLFSHWITPEFAPKRYDTRFFVAAVPPGQEPVHDDRETVASLWVRPEEALARGRRGEFELIFPTIRNLEAIAGFGRTAELLAAAADIGEVPAMLPRVAFAGGEATLLLPGDPGYDAAGSGLGGEDDAGEDGTPIGAAGGAGRDTWSAGLHRPEEVRSDPG